MANLSLYSSLPADGGDVLIARFFDFWWADLWQRQPGFETVVLALTGIVASCKSFRRSVLREFHQHKSRPKLGQSPLQLGPDSLAISLDSQDC